MLSSALALREVHTSGTLDSRAFTIKPSGKAFKALIDSMYPDKIKAPLRELWSNAYDAHVAAGIAETPFQCQLPTVYEPVFSVRDFGVSMSHEDIMDLYSVLFESSKEKTRSQVGMWGLGSKSPFAYVDTFSVTAWLNGEMRVYTAYIGADLVPRIDLMVREPSDEPRGLLVSFPCKVNDIDAFVVAAKKIALGFTVLPEILGHKVAFTKLGTVLEDEGLWSLCKADEGYFNADHAYARQGCVVYPIDYNSIPDVTPEQTAVLRSPFFINFAIDDLDITINREALDYNPRTCHNILKIIDIIITEVRERYSMQVAECTTYWEACNAFAQLQTGSAHETLKELLTAGMHWRGRELGLEINLYDALGRSVPDGTTNTQATYYGMSGIRRQRMMKWQPSRQIMHVSPVSTYVYFEDTRKSAKQSSQGRIRYHFDKQARVNCQATSLLWIKADPTTMHWKRVYAQLGRPTLCDVAQLPKPPPEIHGYTRKPVKMRVLTGTSFVTADVDEDEATLYVNMDRGDIMGPKNPTSTVNAFHVRDVQIFLTHLTGLDKTIPIIGVPRTCKSVIARNPHWRCLWDVAREAVAEGFNPALAAKAEACNEIVCHDDFELVRGFRSSALLPASTRGVMAKYMALYDRICVRAAGVKAQRTWFALAQIIIKDVKLRPYHVHYLPLKERVDATYPMFALMVEGTKVAGRELVMDYVNLVDKSLAQAQGA